MTRKEKVLALLKSKEWVTNYEIQSVEYGGVAGLRRLRELRQEGYQIEIKRCIRDGKPSGTFLYRLTGDTGKNQVLRLHQESNGQFKFA